MTAFRPVADVDLLRLVRDEAPPQIKALEKAICDLDGERARLAAKRDVMRRMLAVAAEDGPRSSLMRHPVSGSLPLAEAGAGELPGTAHR